MVRGLFLKAFAVAFVLALGVLCAFARPERGASGNSLDQGGDTLRYDNGTIAYAFEFPDPYGDDLRNERFQNPYSDTLLGVMIAFGTRSFHSFTTGDPQLVIKLWPSGPDSFPVLSHQQLSDTIPFSAYSSSIFNLDSVWHNQPSQFVLVDLSSFQIPLDSGAFFHVGYTAIRNSADDSLAILSDGSYGSISSSEYYNGHFVLMSAGWQGINFMIRPIVSSQTFNSVVLEPTGAVTDFRLHPAYPNPFNPQTTITFDLAQPQMVRLTVWDILGREQAVLARQIFGAGQHSLAVNGAEWSSGIYFVRLESNAQSQTVKIVLEK